MSVNIRIKHRPHPGRPEDPNGIIEVEVNGAAVSLPLKGYDKVLIERPTIMQSHVEQNRDKQQI